MTTRNGDAVKVLLVDDEIFLVDEIAEYLSRREFAVVKTYGGRAALEILSRDDGGGVTHLILDLRMPDIDGFAVLQSIDRELLTELNIIAVSGHATRDDEKRAKALGVNAFLEKPFDLKKILDLLR